MSSIPLSLYIHVPWCERKCPYCDFNSHEVRSDRVRPGEVRPAQPQAGFDEAKYVECLLADLDADLQRFGSAITDRAIHSIFIGGGTPSLFGPTSYQLLLQELRARLALSDDIEITLEANPGSSEAEKFTGFRQAGINRLSIGVQSFHAQHLLSLGRIHGTNEAVRALEYAKQAGFDNVNLDLMFGLPKQSIEQALSDLKQAISLSPTHLSCYQLTIEPNTLFHHNPPVTPDDEALWEMQNALQEMLVTHAYQHYEISAYSQLGRQCHHNLNYWQFGDYLGIGAGAHAKITHDGTLTRSWKIKHPATYMQKSDKIGGLDIVEPQQRPLEFMMNALRLNNGFSIRQFEERTDLSIDAIQPLLERHTEQGLIVRTESSVKPTSFGHNMLNTMLEDYLGFELLP